MLDACRENEVSREMHLFKAEQYLLPEDADIHYGLLPYEENIAKILESNCILEIVREGFIGFTQRYYEAIVYNRKLLTNNAEIKELPYYDERYMQYFEKPEDIDWDWVKDPEEVDYCYQGDFSPAAWKENMIRVMQPV